MATKSTNTPTPRQRKPRAAAKPVEEIPVINKNQRPVFRVGTWAALLLFAVLIGLAVFLNKKKETTPEETPTKATTSLFAATDGTPSSIEVKPAEGDAVRIARNKDNVWVLEMPLETEADQGLSEAAATQISAIQEVSTVEGDPAIFGLANPAYLITVKFASGKEHTLEVGDITPSNSGYYVRVDKGRIVVADLSGIEAILQLQVVPPYLNTPTPTPTLPPPTETPTPAPPTETVAPEATVTPTP